MSVVSSNKKKFREIMIFDFAIKYTRLVMRMKSPLAIVFFLTGVLPSICWASDSYLARSPDWERSVYFCEATRRLEITRNHLKEFAGENLFKFKMTVTRHRVVFSEASFHNLDQVKFNGQYDWWDGANTYYGTNVSFNGRTALDDEQPKKGHFMYYVGGNNGYDLTTDVLFADCYEFKD